MTGNDHGHVDPPKVSVVMPAYNAARFVADAVESILAQTFRDFELLIYDDGSRDSTADVCAVLANRGSRVRVFRGNANKGIVHALNFLISESRAPYIARMDADDIALADRLERQIRFLDDNPETLAVGGCVELMDEAEYPISIIHVPVSHDEIDDSNLNGRVAMTHPTVVIRREALLRVGGYALGSDGAEDLDLWLRLGEIGRLANLAEVVLRYRLSEKGISQSNREAQMLAVQRACEAARRRRGIAGPAPEPQHWRPGPDRASQLAYALRYGWMAWNNGHRATWRRYAVKSLRLAPLHPDAWRLAIFGALRRPARSG